MPSFPGEVLSIEQGSVFKRKSWVRICFRGQREDHVVISDLDIEWIGPGHVHAYSRGSHLYGGTPVQLLPEVVQNVQGFACSAMVSAAARLADPDWQGGVYGFA